MSTLDEAIQSIRMGNRDEGRQILETLLDEDEKQRRHLVVDERCL